MGTTLVAVVFCGNRVSIGHIGGFPLLSPARRQVRAAHPDHSLLQERSKGHLTRTGQIFAEQESRDPRAGHRGSRTADIAEYRVEANDIFLLCSMVSPTWWMPR